MDKILRLKVYVDGVNDRPFPSAEDQIEVGAFRYDAKRMGGAPIITATVNYPTCLDKEWNDLVYTELNGEKYFLKQTPTSTLSNEDARYKHDLVMVAERVILDEAYFFDAVVGNPLENDKPVTNSINFNFYGSIEEFVNRMNASLQYTKLQSVSEDGVISGYRVILDDDVVTREQKQVVFDGAAFSQALQECYNTFGIPYYFDGKEIHVGYTNNVISDVLEYGVDGALLSASKQNANFKVINRATGEGSSDNIPYYYPNNSSKGEIDIKVNTSSQDLSVKIKDYDKFAEDVKIDDIFSFIANNTNITKGESNSSVEFTTVGSPNTKDYRFTSLTLKSDFTIESQYPCKRVLRFVPTNTLVAVVHGFNHMNPSLAETARHNIANIFQTGIAWLEGAGSQSIDLRKIDTLEFEVYLTKGSNTLNLTLEFKTGYYNFLPISKVSQLAIDGECSWNMTSLGEDSSWRLDDEGVNLEDYGLEVIGTPNEGDTITQRLIKKVNTSSTLQPSIYRATDGKERFYNAINYPFAFVDGYELKYGEYVLDGEVHNDAYKKDDGTYYEFTNEYKEGRPREHVFTVEDAKPTIKEATNDISWVEQDEEGNNKTIFQRIDMFSEFAYNIGDNDETYTDPNENTSFKHPYFFAKLRKLDFNLFEHASEMGEMTFSMTSGNCGACNFKIGVSEDYPQYNTVQVWEEDTTDENGVFHKAGSLKYDVNGYVLCGLEDFQGLVQPQDRQQDTEKYEVWVALKKEEDTYGILMPKAPVDGVGGHRPVACSSENANDGDTFVIININLPDEYIYRAEKKLEKAIVKYIWENNVEKFNFSVNFSRIFLEENPDVLNALNENARLTRVQYNGDEYILYVSSYSYSMNEGDVLPEIRVELDDTLTISQNALQNAINSVKSDIASAINAIDVAAIGSKYFLRKDTYDVAEAPIEFKQGVVFGDNGMVEVNEDGTSKLTIDYLDVTRKAIFTSLEIQEKSHVGGEILITPASMVCNKVEELEDAYRCYFETLGNDGEEIFNQFVEGDQAISQTFNEWGGHYYWRLVTGTGRNYIDLSKTDCAPESDEPSVGDKIIQLGNRTYASRQAAQILSSYGESAPAFIMYNGIDSFTLNGKEVTGILWNPETLEPQMYSYGSFFFGDGTKDDKGNLNGNFITFQKKDGDTEKTLTINADVQLGGGSTGLSNLSEWKEQSEKVDEVEIIATNAANEAENNKVSVQRVQAQVNTIEDNVSEALELAASAQETANEATQKLEDLASDNIISPSEKQALRTELANVNADYIDIEKQYQKYIVEFDVLILTDGKTYVTEDGFVFNVEVANTNWTAFETAQLAYKKDLTNKVETEGSVGIGDLLAKQSAYYSARTSILEDISLAIKAEADYSVKRAAAADKAANEAKESFAIADASIKNLDQKITDVETGVNKSIEEINLKLDGVVESYFDDYTPLRTNEPARTWIREETEADHVGDTFTNTATEGDDAGKSWRWLEREDGTYDWQQIVDSDAAKALVLAGQAQAAADGKNTTFLVKPNKAYKKGDIWIIGSDYIPTGYKQGDILTTTRDNESYVSSDWSKLVRYIGDDALSATREELEEAIENAEKAAKDYTDKGKAALQDSIDTLEQTKASVESVDAITKSDGLISAAEQRAIEAAEAAADAAQKAAETNANAYADGEIKKAEQEAIDTANANLEAAKAELNESIARLDEDTSDAMDAAEAAATKAEAAQSEAATATETSNAAKDIADAAKGLAEAADSNASQAVNSAEEANTKALAAEGIAQQAQELADSAKTLADTANANAASAAKDASDAKEEASVASGKLSNWASDLVISPFEKQGVKDEYAFVVADKEDIDKQVAKYNIEDNTFGTTYNIYKSDLETIVNATTESVAIPTGMSTHQSEYYSARTTILEAISTAAKEVADNAQSAANLAQDTADNAQIAANNAQKDAEAAQRTANEAKAAADAAKLVTDNLNNDLVFSLTEKRSIRSKLKDINPSETPAINVNTFMLGAIESKGSGSWSKVTDEADANYGWYVSDMHTDGSYAIAKVNFTVAEDGSSMTIHIMSRAESTYDYTMLGTIDTELSSPIDTTTGIVAHTRGKQGQDISYTFTNLKAGSHFFCVYYRKDGSTSTSPDNGYFKIDDALFLKGSLGDYLALCKEKGISGSDATAKATSLFAYLYGKGVWNNTDTVLSKSDDFRNRVYGLFQDYYAAITGIQQEITKSDYEYLTEAFGKSKNLNVEGVVMSQLMAVRNKDEEVEAIFNGSDYANDTSHGKLILAGGIPEETSSGSTDLEERTKEATTRIYEDGHVETNDIEAVDGTFSGALKLKFQTVTAGTTHTLTESDSSSIYLPVGYMVSTELVLPNNDVFDGILLNVFCYPRITKGEAISRVSGTILCPGQFGIGTNVVSEIEFPNGGFAQFTYSALKQEWVLTNLQAKNALVSDARVITTAKTAASPNVLDDLDHSVFVNLTSGTCYIDLPQNPQDGQEYYIESRGANMSIKMYQQGYSLYSGKTADAGYSVSQTGRALLRFKYYAKASLWVYSWLNRNS